MLFCCYILLPINTNSAELLLVSNNTFSPTATIRRCAGHLICFLDSVLQELQFAVGRYCCARLQMYHALVHYKHRLRGKLKKHIKHAYNMQKVTYHHAHLHDLCMLGQSSHPFQDTLVYDIRIF